MKKQTGILALVGAILARRDVASTSMRLAVSRDLAALIEPAPDAPPLVVRVATILRQAEAKARKTSGEKKFAPVLREARQLATGHAAALGWLA